MRKNNIKSSVVFDSRGYSDDPLDVLESYEYNEKHGIKPLTREEATALGIPTPEEVAEYLKKRRVNIMLRNETINRFKAAAKKQNTKYQTLISSALDAYSKRYL
jgi:predicted DNA binding CopG/RHH family protein